MKKRRRRHDHRGDRAGARAVTPSDDRAHGRRRVGHLHRLLQERPRRLEPTTTPVPDDHDPIPGAYLGPRRRDDGNPHAMVNHIVKPPAPRAERNGRAPDVLGLEPAHEPVPRRGHDLDVRRRRQPRVVVHHARIATLMLDDLPQLLDARPRRDRPTHACLGVRVIARDARDDEHARRQQHRQLLQIGRAAALQRLDRFDHLARVPDRAAERRVHAR